MEALRKANIIGHEDSLLLLNEEETKVKRAKPVVQLTEEEEKELNDRTIHFKGIPQDATLEEIRAFCSQYGKVESVEMRKKREDRTFKVSQNLILFYIHIFNSNLMLLYSNVTRE